MTLHTSTPFNLTISITSFTNSFGAKRFQKVAIAPHFASRSKRIIRFHSHHDKTDHHFPVIKGSPLKNPILVKGGRVFFSYVVKEISNVMVAMVDLPGLGKEDLTVWIEGKSVRIKGEDAEGGVNYDGAIEIPLSEGEYKEEDIWAVMEKGILQVVIPKMGFVEKNGITNIPIF